MHSGRSRNRSPTSLKEEYPPCNELYVTFLPEDIEEAELQQIFSQVFPVHHVKIRKKSDGFVMAYIRYQQIDHAKETMKVLHKKRIHDKTIRVQYGKQNDSLRPRSTERSREKNNNNQRNGVSDSRKRFGGHEEKGNRGPLKCYNCQGEGHMSRNCPEQSRKPNKYNKKKSQSSMSEQQNDY